MPALSFDRAADDYDATRGYPPQVAEAIGRAFFALAGGQPGLSALEIGVGTGRIAIPLAQAGANVTGIDVSPLMLERLRAKWAGVLREQEPAGVAAGVAAGGSLRAEEGDITALPFASDTFDAVVAVHILHLVVAWRRALDEALRVLGPTGALLIGQDRWPNAVAIQMQQQWEALVGELGFDTHRPGAQFDVVVDELRARGLTVDVTVPVTWVARRTPRAYLEALAARSSSSTWAVPDAIFAASLARMRTWAEERFGARLDEAMEERGEFHVARAVRASSGEPA
jgi:ubiquinone/menaquinone biosynthesis C-methylase UbiE